MMTDNVSSLEDMQLLIKKKLCFNSHKTRVKEPNMYLEDITTTYKRIKYAFGINKTSDKRIKYAFGRNTCIQPLKKIKKKLNFEDINT